jgi:hypothetical protein
MKNTMNHAWKLLGALLLAASSAQAAPHVAIKRPVDVPPSADLHYTIRANQKGLTLDGTAQVKWRAGEGSYSVSSESRASIFGKILENRSEGRIDAYGLAPSTWYEKRLRKEGFTTTFDRGGKTVSFSASERSYPLLGGEQDRASAQWQLAAVARAAPEKMVAGSEWKFFVAGRRDAEQWTFKVIGRDKLRTPLGTLETVHLSKSPPAGYPDQKLDLWLAPGREWYPVKLRLEEDGGEFVEQTISAITPG